MNQNNIISISKKELFTLRLLLIFGFLTSLVYVVLNLVSGVQEKSAWFVILAVYYLALAIMRFLMLGPAIKNSFGNDLISEYRKSRFCGVVLLLLNILLTIMVADLIAKDTRYEESTARLMLTALYAIICFFSAMFDVIKFKKYGSPLLSASRVINFTAAMVTLLSLETAMLNRFNTEGDIFRVRMLAISGVVVCALVLILSLIMIVRANTKLKELEK